MSTEIEKIQAAHKQRTDKHISTRAKIEIMVQEFYTKLETVDVEVKAKLSWYTGTPKTAKDLFPSLYLETFDKVAFEAYTLEKEAFDNQLAELEVIREYLKVEAKKELGLEV